jgi:adenine deaminase
MAPGILVTGLRPDKPLEFVVRKLNRFDHAVGELGATVEHLFGIISFMALPVIPELKLTDQGLVDVNRFDIVELFI